MTDLTDVGMVFVRCAGGISHSPEESVTEGDAVCGTELLLRTVERLMPESNS